MKQQLEARLKELTEQAERILADLNYTVGRKDEVLHILNLMKNEDSEYVDLIGKPDAN